MPGVTLATSGDCSAARARSDVVTVQSVPAGWPIPMPSTTVDSDPGDAVPVTLASMTSTSPVVVTVNEKNADPPTASVPSNSCGVGPVVSVGSVVAAFWSLPPQADKESASATAASLLNEVMGAPP